jgi:hypothetical protein
MAVVARARAAIVTMVLRPVFPLITRQSAAQTTGSNIAMASNRVVSTFVPLSNYILKLINISSARTREIIAAPSSNGIDKSVNKAS